MPDPVASRSLQHSSVTGQDYLAAQFSSDTFSFLSVSLRFDNHYFTFQHQTLSSLSTKLHLGSWIIESGATTHVCSNLALFIVTYFLLQESQSHFLIELKNLLLILELFI